MMNMRDLLESEIKLLKEAIRHAEDVQKILQIWHAEDL
jgi:hypothetical protein